MNRLYSILTYKEPSITAEDVFCKRREAVLLSDRTKELVDYIMEYRKQSLASIQGITSVGRTGLACLICWCSRYTPFGPEIQKLDSDNTYTNIMEYIKTTGTIGPIYHLIRPEGEEGFVMYGLDEDIRERLYAPTWLELAGGISLQALRNTYA